MNLEEENVEEFENELSSWAIPLNEPEAKPDTTPEKVEATDFAPQPPAPLPFRMDELPTEGFSPHLSRFDEVA
jgi:hypothetical protein